MLIGDDISYSCGGVGHLSRDCVQGSKCYNCSGVVSIIILFVGEAVDRVALLGTHQQGLPPAPEAGLLYLRL